MSQECSRLPERERERERGQRWIELDTKLDFLQRKALKHQEGRREGRDGQGPWKEGCFLS